MEEEAIKPRKLSTFLTRFVFYRNKKLGWGVIVGAFFLMAVWPIWSVRFPPMQDYPLHLFQALVLSNYNNSAFDYRQHFEIHLQPAYASFYLITLLFSCFFPIEVAGKLSLSLYPALVAILVLRLGSRLGREAAPWGALLFFPLAFNQQYFLGFINYLLSVPILILALLDYEDFLGGILAAWPVFRHFLWQIVLFITHPFTFCVYILLAVVAAFMLRWKATQFKVKILALLGGAIIPFVASWIISKGTPSLELPAAPEIAWISPESTVEFFALMFNGMQGFGNADYVALVLWGSVFIVVLGALIADWRGRGHLPLLYMAFLISTILGFFILPFKVGSSGSFAYINVRIASIIYFLIALLVARVRFRGWRLYSLISLLGLCMVDSAVKQARISEETSEIVPIVSSIPPNSSIFPLVFDSGSPELDRTWFDVHLHDHNYYHILVGGGFNPYLFRAPSNPVRYRSGQEPYAPNEFQPYQFSWQNDSADYQYFLLRGLPPAADKYMSQTCHTKCVSGSWTLFERKPGNTGGVLPWGVSGIWTLIEH